MSLLDYAPRTPPEQDAEVHLKMYLSGRSFLAMIAATGLVLLLLAAYYLVVVDPNWHPKHVRGKGAWFVLLMFLLPVFWRAFLLWFLGGLTATSSVLRAIRLGDRRIDYTINRHGVTNMGLFYSRHVDWYQIQRIIIFEQGSASRLLRRFLKTPVLFAEFQPTSGAIAKVEEAFPFASTPHIFGRSKIVMPLYNLRLSAAQLTEIIQNFQPQMPISQEVR